MLCGERPEELKLLSLSGKLRCVLISACKYHHREKLLGTRVLLNVRERQNKNQWLKQKPAKEGLKSRCVC